MSLWICPTHGLYGGTVFCPQCGGTGAYATLAPRDSDRNPEGEKPQALSAQHESAGRQASPPLYPRTPTMADPIQTARIVEAMAMAICRSGKFETGEGTCAPICMEALGDPRKSGCGHACRLHAKLAQAALSTAYPMIREEMARVCDALAANPDWQSPIARETARCAFEEAAEAIRATDLRAQWQAGQEGEG